MRVILLCLLLSGCAYNQQSVYCGDGCTVYCNGTVDKPVSTSTLPIKLDAKLDGNTIPISAIP